MAQSSPGSVADALWAAAVLDVSAPAAISRLRELAAILNTSQLDANTLQQIFAAHMALERTISAGGAEQGAPLLPPGVLQQAKAAWQDKLSKIAATQVIFHSSASITAFLSSDGRASDIICIISVCV